MVPLPVQLLASDELHRVPGVALKGPAKRFHDQLRSVFASPAALALPADISALVRMDPLSGLPFDVVPAVDDNGQPVFARRVDAPLVVTPGFPGAEADDAVGEPVAPPREGGSGPAAHADAAGLERGSGGNNEDANGQRGQQQPGDGGSGGKKGKVGHRGQQQQSGEGSGGGGGGGGVSTPLQGRVLTDFLRSLPPTTLIAYEPNTKRQESKARYAKYCGAKSIKEYRERHPGPASMREADLANDVKTGRIFFTDRELAEKLRDADGFHRVLAVLVGQEVLPDENGQFSTLQEYADRVAKGVEEGSRDRNEAAARLAATDQTAVKVQEIADLEQWSGYDTFTVGDPAVYNVMLEDEYYGPPLAPVDTGGELDVSDPAIPECLFNQSTNVYRAFPITGTKALAPGNYATVIAAYNSGEWEGPGGFYEVGMAEITRVFVKHKALKVVPISEYYAAKREDPDNTHMERLVTPCTTKMLALGEVNRKKMRITFAEAVHSHVVANKSAPTVAPDTIRFLTCLAVRLEAETGTSDVGGAYFWGKVPKKGEPGYRRLFAVIPNGYEHLGFKRVDARGKLVLEVTGNCPGRQDAGRIWGEEYTAFLLMLGYKQSIVDRRVYYFVGVSAGELIVIGVFVDDNWYMHTSATFFQTHFVEPFEARFETAPDVDATAKEFCGAVFEIDRVRKTAQISAPGIIDRLEVALQQFEGSYPQTRSLATPMLDDVPRIIQEKAAPEDLMPVKFISHARSLLGIGGWVAVQVRPEIFFAFVVLSQQIVVNLSKACWQAVLQWARHLVAHRNYKLTYSGLGLKEDFEFFVDSSLINGPGAGSLGGFVGCFPGSGAFAWRTLCHRSAVDSSMGAELLFAVTAGKAVLGWRMLARELQQASRDRTTLRIDASAVLGALERNVVTRESRFLAARLAMLRELTQLALVAKKVATGDNIADAMTKALKESDFVRQRANLGVLPSSLSASAGAEAPSEGGW